jgi:hypothetical protein
MSIMPQPRRAPADSAEEVSSPARALLPPVVSVARTPLPRSYPVVLSASKQIREVAASSSCSSSPALDSASSATITRLCRASAVTFDSQKLQEDCERSTALRLGLSYPPLLETLPRLGITRLPFDRASIHDNSSLRCGPLFRTTPARKSLFDFSGDNPPPSVRPEAVAFELEDGLWNFEREAITNRKGAASSSSLPGAPGDNSAASPPHFTFLPSGESLPSGASFSPVLLRLRSRLRELTATPCEASHLTDDDRLSSLGKKRNSTYWPFTQTSEPTDEDHHGDIPEAESSLTRTMSQSAIEKKSSIRTRGLSMNGKTRRSTRRSTRWSIIDDHNHFISAAASVEEEGPLLTTMESETNLPVKNLHIYLQYCAMQKTVIILRPVSDSVPDLYAGTCMVDRAHSAADGTPLICGPHESYSSVMAYTNYECRVKGKSIQVTLKSSPYPPIDGCIPVNPALGKAYIDAQRREREIEDMLLSSGTAGLATVFVRKLKAQKAHASAMTAAFVRDTHAALEGSNKRFQQLIAQYKDEVVATTDKIGVSRRYIDRLNDAQFLGVAGAKWRGWAVYYTELPNSGGSVLRDAKDVPVFHIRKGSDYFLFDAVERDVAKEPAPAEVVADLRPVEIVTHRTFYISKGTCRIEEEQSAYIIGPDFDGLSYAQNYQFDEFGEPRRAGVNPYTAQDHIEWAIKATTLQLREGMGLTSELDEAHITLMRFLTDWKQNHGYECHNVVKSQPITKGNYTCITPTSFFILRDFEEIISFYRSAWKDGTPLLLNPSWKVCIRNDGLPCAFGDELDMPIVDDCGYADLTLEVERYEKAFQVQGLMQKFAQSYVKMKDRHLLVTQHSKSKVAKMMSFASDSILTMAELEAKYNLFYDKKTLSNVFFEVRRWQLLPPRFCTAQQTDDSAEISQREIPDGSMRKAPPQSVAKPPPVSASPYYKGTAQGLVIDAPVIAFGPTVEKCSVFEEFRSSKLAPLLVEFEEAVALFDELHPDSVAFTDLLVHFVFANEPQPNDT